MRERGARVLLLNVLVLTKRDFAMFDRSHVRSRTLHRFVEHWGEEHYCTVSQVKVHGIGVNEFLSEEWEESNRQQEIRLEEVRN